MGKASALFRLPLLNERDIVNNENAVLANGGEVLDDALRT
jgi:hypothetical protein